jgi:hypothetical protein
MRVRAAWVPSKFDLRRVADTNAEEPFRELLDEPVDLHGRGPHHLDRLPKRVGDCKPGAPVRWRAPRARPGNHRTRMRGRVLLLCRPAHERDQLPQEKRAIRDGATERDRGRDVRLLEPEHEICGREVDVAKASRPMSRQVHPEITRDLDRLRERRHGSELERPDGAHPQVDPGSMPPKERLRQRTARAVSGADEDDIEHAAGIRAGRAAAGGSGRSVRSARPQERRQREEDKAQILLEGPARDVQVIELRHLVERNVAPTKHLPQPGHSRL